MDLSSFLEKTFSELSKQVPGFISITLLKGDDGTLMYTYPPSNKKEQELVSPFHMQIYKQALKSLEMEGQTDVIEEILISTKKRLYVMASRTLTAIGVVVLDIEKANLALARLHTRRAGDEVAAFLKNAM